MKSNMPKNYWQIMFIIIAIAILLFASPLKTSKKETTSQGTLEKKIQAALENQKTNTTRPDYLPEVMYKELPPFPPDFYKIRTLVWAGMIKDLSKIGEEYWKQPEWFPKFEKIGVPLLQNPPENRWGAYGISSYPSDAVGNINIGDSLDFYFYIRSSYLVETYQGLRLVTKYPQKAEITTGQKFPDGNSKILQDPKEVAQYFDVKTEPSEFILTPNFPLFTYNGTRRIKVTITPKPGTPEGDYAIGIDIAKPSEENRNKWLMKYLNLYVDGGMTQIDRPYYLAFVHVSAPK